MHGYQGLNPSYQNQRAGHQKAGSNQNESMKSTGAGYSKSTEGNTMRPYGRINSSRAQFSQPHATTLADSGRRK